MTQLYDNASRTGQPNVNATALKGLVVPVTGKICRIDAKIVKYPNRYMDEQGQEMWNKIMIILEKVKE